MCKCSLIYGYVAFYILSLEIMMIIPKLEASAFSVKNYFDSNKKDQHLTLVFLDETYLSFWLPAFGSLNAAVIAEEFFALFFQKLFRFWFKHI